MRKFWFSLGRKNLTAWLVLLVEILYRLDSILINESKYGGFSTDSFPVILAMIYDIDNVYKMQTKDAISELVQNKPQRPYAFLRDYFGRLEAISAARSNSIDSNGSNISMINCSIVKLPDKYLTNSVQIQDKSRKNIGHMP